MKPITQDELIDDVVKALRKLGGRAEKSRVLLLIYTWRREEFSQSYYKEIVNSGVPRWKKHIEWAKQKAVILGLVSRPNESGWGIWELQAKCLSPQSTVV